MTLLASEAIQHIILQHLADEVTCEPVDAGYVACEMPLQYPSGDSITVWVEQLGGRFRVSDYGEAFLDLVASKRRDITTAENAAREVGRRWGVEVKRGSLVALSDLGGLGDAVWRVATVAHRVAQVALRMRPQHPEHERDEHFILEVEHEMRERHLPIERRRALTGYSGHQHKAALYIPTSQAILEPINTSANYSQISSVYMKFGDLTRSNGFKTMSLVDDRVGVLGDEWRAMLVQVSDIVEWTRRDEWLSRLS